MEQYIIELIYVLVAFLAVAISSYINWKASDPPEGFNTGKFLSAYVRTVWAIIPSALVMSADLGLTVTGLLAIAGLAFGVDNIVLTSKSLGTKPSTETEITPVSG